MPLLLESYSLKPPPIGHEVNLKTEYRLRFLKKKRSTRWVKCSQAWVVWICRWRFKHLCARVRLRDAKCVIVRFCQEGWGHVCICKRNIFLFLKDEHFHCQFGLPELWVCFENWFRWIVWGGWAARVGWLLRQSLEESQETHSSTKTGSGRQVLQDRNTPNQLTL